eukprot:364527-Chlamydomonas_euryale.AAC.8
MDGWADASCMAACTGKLHECMDGCMAPTAACMRICANPPGLGMHVLYKKQPSVDMNVFK